MTLAENLAPFFSDFAVDAVLDGAAVRGVFDAQRDVVAFAGDVIAARPMFLLPSASVPSAPAGKTLTIGATTYRVRAAVPDGTGLTTLYLET